MRPVCALAVLGVTLLGCGSDPCASQSGACLGITVNGSVGKVDELHFDITGDLHHSFTSALPAGRGLPASVAVLLPDGLDGTASIHAVAYHAGAQVGIGGASVTFHADSRTHATIALASSSTASCSDGALDGDETDVDCGGSCASCAPGLHCSASKDCATALCVSGACAPATCTDGVKNGTETDLDCGGMCAGCADGKTCGTKTDCTSDVCTASICQVPTCTDGVKNGSESDVDCGGSCSPCKDGSMCKAAADCASAGCSNGACLLSSGGACTSPAECASQDCVAERCALTPMLAKVTPALVPSIPGTAITIDGASFVAGSALAVTIDGVAATSVKLVSATRLTATTPIIPGKHGPVTLAVTSGDGQVVTSASLLGYYLGQLTLSTPSLIGLFSGWGAGRGRVADFDEDGLPDVLVFSTANAYGDDSGGTFYLAYDMLVSGHGTFAIEDSNDFAAFSYADQPPYADFGVGELTGDGHVDAVFFENDELELWSGDGKGGLKLASTTAFPVASGTGSPVLADFDGDGKLDLALPSSTQAGVLYLGDGAGHFGTGTPLPMVGQQSYFAAVLWAADLNADGKADLVYGSASGEQLVVQLATGGGAFGTPALYTYATSSQMISDVEFADLDGNGTLDVVVGTQTAAVVFTTTKSATATLVQTATLSTTNAGVIAIGDFDGDGQKDLVVNELNAELGDRFRGLGKGTFATAVPIDLGASTARTSVMVPMDSDGDGKLDLVVINTDALLAPNSQIIGTPTTVLPATPDVYYERKVVAASIDHDGTDDLLLGFGKFIQVELGSPTHATKVSATLSFTTQLYDFAALDIDGDGNLDLVAVQDSGPCWFAGKGDGTFGAMQTLVSPIQIDSLSTWVTGADLDGDGHVDLVYSNPMTVGVMLGDGKGGFVAGATLSSSGPVAIADLDQDGKLDLVGVTNAAEQDAEIFYGTGGGLFKGVQVVTTAAGDEGAPQIGDVDGDGLLDIEIGSVLLTQSKTGWTASTGGWPGSAVGFADVVRSGRPAIVFQSGSSFGFEAPQIRTSTYATNSVSGATGDFDGDGLIDLAVINRSTPPAIFWNVSR